MLQSVCVSKVISNFSSKHSIRSCQDTVGTFFPFFFPRERLHEIVFVSKNHDKTKQNGKCRFYLVATDLILSNAE